MKKFCNKILDDEILEISIMNASISDALKDFASKKGNRSILSQYNFRVNYWDNQDAEI
jgi:hypothetical protein